MLLTFWYELAMTRVRYGKLFSKCIMRVGFIFTKIYTYWYVAAELFSKNYLRDYSSLNRKADFQDNRTSCKDMTGVAYDSVVTERGKKR